MKIKKEYIAKCGMNCALCIAFIDKKNPCPGCKSNDINVRRGCQNCSFYHCNHQCNYCFECPIFPCYKLKKLDKRYKEKYHMSMIENLLFLKQYGMEEFLIQQEKKYTCSNCNEIISVHRNVCPYCKNIIEYNQKNK